MICISDSLRNKAKEILTLLFEISSANMFTGDNYRTADSIDAKVGIVDFYARVLLVDMAPIRSNY